MKVYITKDITTGVYGTDFTVLAFSSLEKAKEQLKNCVDIFVAKASEIMEISEDEVREEGYFDNDDCYLEISEDTLIFIDRASGDENVNITIEELNVD